MCLTSGNFFPGHPRVGAMGAQPRPPPFWTSEICGFQGFLKPNDYCAPRPPPLDEKYFCQQKELSFCRKLKFFNPYILAT